MRKVMALAYIAAGDDVNVPRFVAQPQRPRRFDSFGHAAQGSGSRRHLHRLADRDQQMTPG